MVLHVSLEKLNCCFESYLQMAYAIVEFLGVGEIEVVPGSWVRDNVCMWPKAPADKVKALIRRNQPCRYSPPWQSYSVRVKGLFCKRVYL